MMRGAFTLLLGIMLTLPSVRVAAQVAVVSSAELDCAREPEDDARPGRDRECVREVEETVTRLSAELRAAGFVVTLLSHPTAPDEKPESVVAELGLQPAPVGVFVVSPVEGAPSIEVSLTDRSTKEVLRFTLRAPTASGRAPALLAVRAMELVRANALVLEIPRATPPPPKVEVVVPVQEEPAAESAPQPPWTWLLGVAGAGLWGPGGFGIDALLRLRVGVRGPRGLGVQLLGAGPSVGKTLKGDEGHARVSQSLAALVGTYRLSMSERLSVAVQGGAGAHHLSVRGRARAPLVAQDRSVWSMIAVGGAAAWFQAAPRLWLGFELEMFMPLSRVSVRVADETVGSLGRPTLVSGLGLQVEL